MDRHNGSGLRHSLDDAPQREGEPTPDRVLRPHSTSLGLGSGRLVRLFLVGCLLALLAGGAPLLRPPAVQAARAAPVLGHTVPLGSLHPSGKDDGDNCAVITINCGFVQPVQLLCPPVVRVVQVVPVVREVKVFVPVEKKVVVLVPVEKVVKVFVPVPVVATPTPAVRVFVPVPPPATPTPIVVPVLPPATPTPIVVPMPPGDPMF
jgi:hypothetical protein